MDIEEYLDSLDKDNLDHLVNKAIEKVCHSKHFGENSKNILKETVFEVLSSLQKDVRIKPRRIRKGV